MPPEPPVGPWRSFLADIDRVAPEPIEIHVIGGFAVQAHCGPHRSTADLDAFQTVPAASAAWLQSIAGRDSALHRKHGVYCQIASVAVLPESYEDRLMDLFAGEFTNVRVRVLDAVDLALTKLTRNRDVNLEDVKVLARATRFDLETFRQRYYEELRPFLHGPPENHDSTLQLWLEVLDEDRA